MVLHGYKPILDIPSRELNHPPVLPPNVLPNLEAAITQDFGSVGVERFKSYDTQLDVPLNRHDFSIQFTRGEKLLGSFGSSHVIGQLYHLISTKDIDEVTANGADLTFLRGTRSLDLCLTFDLNPDSTSRYLRLVFPFAAPMPRVGYGPRRNCF